MKRTYEQKIRDKAVKPWRDRLAMVRRSVQEMNRVADKLGARITKLERDIHQSDRVISHLRSALQDSEELSVRHSLVASTDSEIKTASSLKNACRCRSGESAKVQCVQHETPGSGPVVDPANTPTSWSQAEAPHK